MMKKKKINEKLAFQKSQPIRRDSLQGGNKGNFCKQIRAMGKGKFVRVGTQDSEWLSLSVGSRWEVEEGRERASCRM